MLKGSRGESWTYLPYKTFADFADYQRWFEEVCRDADRVFYAIVNMTQSQPVRS